jgi:PadR family transcriptional regulator, regulatory protein PadR
MPRRDEPMLLAGTLDLLILRALSWEPRHGYAVAGWIHATSKETIAVEDRALYLALHRLEDGGYVDAEWAYTENNRRAKFYELTAAGRRHLKAQERDFTRYVDAVYLILNGAAEPSGS